jgi:ubiquinone/menaquinone biosynthesis C-methylase UbiE
MSEHKDKDIQFHAEIAAVYDYLTVEPREYANELLFREIGKQINPGNLMIDLGCGTGHMLDRYGGRFANNIGVDHSSEMLAQARHKLARSGRTISLINSDVDNWLDDYTGPLPEFVTAVGFLHHLEKEELKSAISRFYQLVAPGGRLLVAEPIYARRTPNLVEKMNSNSILNDRLIAVMPAGAEEPDEEPLHEAALLEALDESGFHRVVTNKGFDVLHRQYPPGLTEKIRIWFLMNFCGPRKQGDVIAILAEKPL